MRGQSTQKTNAMLNAQTSQQEMECNEELHSTDSKKTANILMEK